MDPAIMKIAAGITIRLILLFLAGVFSGPNALFAGSVDLPEILHHSTPAGWRLYETVKQYTPRNLYERINGRASYFLAYDLRGMTYAGYENRSNPTQFIDLSVYGMGTATNAFGVFSSERSTDGRPIEYGQSGYSTDANCYIWQGRYYIRIICSINSDDNRRISMNLARKLTEALPKSEEQPWGLLSMPREDRIAESIQYVRINAMGLDFMKDTYLADYTKDGTAVTGFLSKKESVDAARTTLERYVDYARRYGKGAERQDRIDVELFACDMGKSYDVLFQKGRMIGGVLDVACKDLALRTTVEFWRQLPAE